MTRTKKRIKDNMTFIVEVKNTEHHTWQGVVTWVEEKKKEPFRSTLELLRLIDSTVDREG